ncbi:arginase [Candidatus Arthromitus sp. SFB-mouse-SU]|uniref:arginase n=1 Tax=unclassified Candidatus Neoarthromitus TaxID=2638829 RepID=UPI0002296937|nr:MULTISPECIES: arginase [unclassified Candidatus Arthromitus]EIA25813.1 arginase [Candidatus Arthromitus sp. SFB-4]EIA27272.1 arginase [Candidatus Arthromitus sp. SFB-co]EIA29813.1 arginase [Candidatus Arthromitus sp. SFB-5]EIA30007.1 arginase [Candidatus Arthromitus sp. SFB-mouse-SU]BAK80282.1 arginase [Candidatus Arthromitus sp. SFB-mouse-Yit]
MNLNIITVSTFYGCDKKGVELGPKALINNNLLSIIKNCGHTINEIIDIPVDIDNKNKFDNNKQIKYFDKVKTIVKNLSISIEESYKNNTFPLVLGGDHAISIGSLAGFSKSFKNTGVIWIDAHGDLNIPSSSPSYNAHGMPLACSLGYGHEEFISIFKKNIDPKNVFLFGIRSLDNWEKEFIIKNEMHIYDRNSFDQIPQDLMIDTLKKYTNKNKIENFHLSFDIDVFDPLIAPGTGTPVKKGLLMDEVKNLMSKLLSSINIVSIDFVEFNPLLDKDNKTLTACLEILEFIFRRIKK